MIKKPINKRKIINDPVYGFINLQSEIIFDLIEHPFLQRLRRIKQLGLSCFVYPGANHTRFDHTLGALHLIHLAIENLQSKGVEITDQEAEAVSIAILLHDIGHGPFSHALEHSLILNVSHEDISLLLMHELNIQFNGKLSLAITIFKNEYHKKFLHQLVSSQLDMDRMDYLRRDSFFSGVVEGTIGSDRIIKMLNVRNNNLVVDYKGIYSVEKFLVARRLMYWQVYLHKTVIVAEQMLINILKRAREIVNNGENIYAPPSLNWFLTQSLNANNLNTADNKSNFIKNFIMLDDSDILSAIKSWSNHSDKVLSFLATAITNRKLLKIEISDSVEINRFEDDLKQIVISQMNIDSQNLDYYVFSGEISNSLYKIEAEKIEVLLPNGNTVALEEASDIDFRAISKTIKKHFLCYPRELDFN